MWGDQDVKLKLLRKGILTRINAPMVRTIFDVCSDKLETATRVHLENYFHRSVQRDVEALGFCNNKFPIIYYYLFLKHKVSYYFCLLTLPSSDSLKLLRNEKRFKTENVT